ncbi:ABC transporter ATP-binding protein [Salinimicrobium oceani]|uniref:ABC transporter ATP-binding protein n=1 Tax=Salinimicrobium oceani TaxID=2722702 RepID=UPI001F325768|nr:ABC transporter ATP-binding protein [Salinimicrobium oceani]
MSFLVGLLDGIGLALFIPLLKLVSEENNTASKGGFITDVVVDFLNVNPTLLNILILILFFFSLKGLVKFFEGYLRVVYQQYFMRQIRMSNIDLLNELDFKEFAKTDAGKIQNTFSGEVNRVNTAFRFYFKSFQYGTLVLVYVIIAFLADPVFSLIVILGGLSTILLFKSLYIRTKYFSKKFTGRSHLYEGLLMQKIYFFKYLKTTGLNIFFGKKLKKNIMEMEKDQLRIGIVDSLLNALREPLVIVVVLFAIYLQVNFFGQDLTLILLSLVLLYRALSFFMGMQEQWNMFLGYSGSLYNMEEFTEELQRAKEQFEGKPFLGFKNALELKRVNFSYGKTEVLRNINLKIQRNETVAFIGESGSGKTTLMNIISGLLIPSGGIYTIDGTAITTLDLYSFRKKIGYIPQDPPVFSDSIFNNVTFWKDKTEENIERFQTALKQAALKEFVDGLPEKEETYLGNTGISLSGGQKQRISIARELFKEIDILLMDEATSALDSETENIIKENIKILKGTVTIILIAHRLSTVKYADRIYMLKEGEVISSGTYNELLQNSESFRRLVALQKV